MSASASSPYPQNVDPYTPAEGGIDIKALLGILKRRRRVIIATIVLLTTLAVLAGLQLTPKYTAKSLVMIDPRQANILDFQQVIQGLDTSSSTVETQIRVLTSRELQERVMERLGLFESPEFNVALRNPKSTDGVTVKAGGPMETLFSWVPDQWLIATGLADEPVPEVDDTVPELVHEATIDQFNKALKVTQEGRSYVLAISFTSESPALAAKVANTLADTYVQAQLDNKVTETTKATGWLGGRLEQMRDEVRRSEEEVERYRREHGLADVQGQALSERELSDLSAQLVAARAELAEKQAKYQLAVSLGGGGGKDLDTVGDVMMSPTIINLREQESLLLKEESELRTYYGEKHPRIQNLRSEKENLERKLQAEVGRIIKNLGNDVQIIKTRVASLETEIGGLTNRNSSDRETEVQLRELEREAAANKGLYEAFLARYKETQDQQDIVEADSKVISVAAPPSRPSTPGPLLFGAVGFTAATMLGTLLALLLERLDSGLRSAKQVENVTGLPALGLVPRLERLKRGQKPHQYLISKPLSAYAEAIRATYTAMQLSDVDNPPKVVLVTSSLPQEGKTTLALSLATFAARSSQRVLLMDLDLRHPSVHRDLIEEPETGFVEYMAGEKTLEEVIKHDAESGIYYLPVKRQTANPTDLLGSQKMKQLVATLREAFDYIVIDSAPLLGVTDSKVAALLADKVVFVTQWEKTTKDTATNALAHLREIKASMAGVVLTQVDVRKHAQYGYGDVGQYYGKYQKYYVN